MYIFTQKGPSINDVIHYRGNLLKSDVTPYISYLLKWVTRGKGGVKNLSKWVTSFMNGPKIVI